MPRLLLTESAADLLSKRLAALPDVDVVIASPDAEGADLSSVDAALRWGFTDDGIARILREASTLRWLHNPGAGVESLPLATIRDGGVTLTNAAGIFSIPLAEWVLASMLRVVKQTDDYATAQNEHRWATDIGLGGELFGRTLLVLGPGGIGAEIITRAAAFGMRIWAANRSGKAVPQATRVLTGDEWRDVLAKVDFLVSTVPMTEESKRMLRREDIAKLSDTAWVINVGRGGTFDEEALLDAAAAGEIGGAALDTFAVEPLPADSRAWDLPNVIVSPHEAGSSDASTARGLDLFVDNLERFVRGDELLNVVDLSAGY